MTQDGEPVGPDDLRKARMHCAECAECAQFETTLKTVRRLRPQALPEEIVVRVMDAVETEAAAERARTEAAAAAAETAAAAIAPEDSSAAPAAAKPAPSGIALPRTRKDWTMWGGWIAAAAVLLVAGGIAAVRGAYFIAAPSTAESGNAVRYSSGAESTAEIGLPPESAADAAKDTLGSVQSSTGYIVFDGWVFRSIGATRPLRSNSPTIGIVSSGLDTGGAIEELPVFEGTTNKTITVQSAEDSFLGFELVWRSFRGQTYGLRSGVISQFGEWPTLPSGVPQPDDADGSPVFERSINDDTGVAVYRRVGQSESSGFAVAPGTSADDPAAGNPSWTWWEPFR